MRRRVLGARRPGAAGVRARFWLTHHTGRSSPQTVFSLDGATRYVQRYPAIACIGASPTNGLLGR